MGSTAVTQLAAPAPAPVPTDEEIVRRVLDGDTPQFELLMRRHNRRIYRTVRAILRDEAESEDAMQAAYLSALAHLGEFHGQAAFSTWLTRIAVNEAFTRLRRRAPVVPIDGGSPRDDEGGGGGGGSGEDPPGPDDPERRAAARELVAILERAVDRLPASYRAIFVLRDVEGLSTADTAVALAIGEDLAKVRLSRARRALRRELVSMLGTDAERAFEFDATRCDRIVRAVLERWGSRRAGTPVGG